MALSLVMPLTTVQPFPSSGPVSAMTPMECGEDCSVLNQGLHGHCVLNKRSADEATRTHSCTVTDMVPGDSTIQSTRWSWRRKPGCQDRRIYQFHLTMGWIHLAQLPDRATANQSLKDQNSSWCHSTLALSSGHQCSRYSGWNP